MKMRKGLIVSLLSVIVVLITAIIVFPIHSVSGKCMEPAIYDGEKVVCNRLSYLTAAPQRGDIVVMQHDDHILLKRIVGLPGETITFYDGDVFVNGIYVNEEYAVGKSLSGNTFEVPQDKYFVLGDNREESYDSRFWTRPYIEENDIIGKAVAAYSIKSRKFTMIPKTVLRITNDADSVNRFPAAKEDQLQTQTEKIVDVTVEMETETETETEYEIETEIPETETEEVIPAREAFDVMILDNTAVHVEPTEKNGTISADYLNARVLPDKAGERVCVIEKGTAVQIIGECDNEWIEITALDENGNEVDAYIHGDYVSID